MDHLMATPAARRKRPDRAPEDILITVCVRLTPAQKEKLYALGGGPWLRERLRRTAAPSSPTNASSVPHLLHP